MVPLDFALDNGQRVEIVAAKTGGPSRDWLTQAGYLTSSRARNKVRQWFNAEELARTVAAGRAIVEREIAREGAAGVKLEALAGQFGFGKADDLFAAVGREEIGPRALQVAVRGPEPVAPVPEETLVTKKSRAVPGASGILVVGVDRLLTQLARCCKPVPPDPIVGFVTRTRGVMVHRADCPNVTGLREDQRDRLMPADWGKTGDAPFSAEIEVVAVDRQGLLRDISEAIARERINVIAVNTLSRGAIAFMRFTLQVSDAEGIVRVLRQVRDVPGVDTTRRL
jgi:GTP pyrophosphokinase